MVALIIIGAVVALGLVSLIHAIKNAPLIDDEPFNTHTNENSNPKN